MYSDETFFYLIDYGHARASVPQDPITTFCSCSVTNSCSIKRRRAARRRTSRRTKPGKGKSVDPGGPSEPVGPTPTAFCGGRHETPTARLCAFPKRPRPTSP